MKKILEEFQAFILRGNVVQLAVAFVMGAAFGKVTAAANDHLIQPLLGMVGGVPSLAWMNVKYFHIGSFLDVCIGFVITAAAVFFIIVQPMNRMVALLEKPKDPSVPEPPKAATLEDVIAELKALRQTVADSAKQ
jgi:large conductance mechanosensitive channel